MPAPYPIDNKQALSLAKACLQKIQTDLPSVNTPEKMVELLNQFTSGEGLPNVEEYEFNGETLKNIQEYKEIRKELFDFFEWITQQKGVNVTVELNKEVSDVLRTTEKQSRTAEVIKCAQSSSGTLKKYLTLNSYRTAYEVTWQYFSKIISAYMTTQGKVVPPHIELKNLEEFKDYQNIDKIRRLFPNDLRNPIAHEDWVIENENSVRLRNKGVDDVKTLLDIERETVLLFFCQSAIIYYALQQLNATIVGLPLTSLTPENLEKLKPVIQEKLKEALDKLDAQISLEK